MLITYITYTNNNKDNSVQLLNQYFFQTGSVKMKHYDLIIAANNVEEHFHVLKLVMSYINHSGCTLSNAKCDIENMSFVF